MPSSSPELRQALRRYFLDIAIWSVCVLPATLALMWVLSAIVWVLPEAADTGAEARLAIFKAAAAGLALIAWFLVLIRIYRRGRNLVCQAEPERRWKARAAGWGGVLLCQLMAKAYGGAALLILWLLVTKGGRL